MDAGNCCLRAGYSRYLVTRSFSWCNRTDCPDNERLNEVGALLDNLGVTDLPHFLPSCPVDQFMLKLVSCVLSHVVQIRTVLAEDEYSYGMDSVTCEHFLGLDWQATFVRKFCTPIITVPSSQTNLISFEPGVVNPPQVQYYRQAFESTVTLFPGNDELDLSQVLPRATAFTLDDLRHTIQ